MEEKTNAFMETESVGRLMRKFSVPCIISLLVAALYNIVDQIFIANASYLGSYGNAANTVVFPLTIVALAIAVMIGDGACAYVSISLGAGEQERAHKTVGNAIVLCIIASIILTALYLILQEPLLTLFGGRVNADTFRNAKEYFFWITLGIPFYMFGQAVNSIIRSDGSPQLCHGSHTGWCDSQYHSGPCFHLPDAHGYGRCCHRNRHGTDPDSHSFHLVPIPRESHSAA